MELSNFESIVLQSVPALSLFTDRVDTKFIFHRNDCQQILDALSSSYVLITNQGKYSQRYTTVYYDSEDLHFYLAHHNGRGNRVKKRTRTYEDGSSFFEIKQKSNKGITTKERLTAASENSLEGLFPQLEVRYDRITMYNKELEEKLTFDFDIHFIHGASSVSYPSLVIAESKKKKHHASLFTVEMKRRRIKSTSLSKYCLGISSLLKQVKKNNFKELLHSVHKINNQYGVSSTG